MANNPLAPKIKVWDVWTRLFHWALPIMIGISWWSVDAGDMALHQASGLIVIGLLVFRLIWGIIGSETSRFAHFIRGPLTGLRHLARFFRSEPQVGHNPAGGWMILFLLTALAVQAGTGLFATDDILFDGPLAPYVSDATSSALTDFHHLWNKILIGLISFHVSTIFLYFAGPGDDLIGPMLSGHKRIAAPAPTMAPVWRIVVAVAAGSALPYYLYSL